MINFTTIEEMKRFIELEGERQGSVMYSGQMREWMEAKPLTKNPPYYEHAFTMVRNKLAERLYTKMNRQMLDDIAKEKIDIFNKTEAAAFRFRCLVMHRWNELTDRLLSDVAPSEPVKNKKAADSRLLTHKQ